MQDTRSAKGTGKTATRGHYSGKDSSQRCVCLPATSETSQPASYTRAFQDTPLLFCSLHRP